MSDRRMHVLFFMTSKKVFAHRRLFCLASHISRQYHVQVYSYLFFFLSRLFLFFFYIIFYLLYNYIIKKKNSRISCLDSASIHSLVPDMSFENTMSVSAMETSSFLTVLEPRMHSTKDFINEKLIFVRMKHTASLQLMLRFSASFSANRLQKQEHSLPIPPQHEKNSSVNVPCSISMTRGAYFTFFSFS